MIERWLQDLGYFVEAIATHDDYVVEFKVWEAFDNNGKMALEGDKLPVEADLFLAGNVKWDGCSNWHFLPHDEIMLHFCSVGQAERIGKLMRRLYEIAAELMPHHDDILD